LLGGDRGLGGLVGNDLRESAAGSPNGPPSHRLAPGGFYGGGVSLNVNGEGKSALLFHKDGEINFTISMKPVSWFLCFSQKHHIDRPICVGFGVNTVFFVE
jgi:hypothetical protein